MSRSMQISFAGVALLVANTEGTKIASGKVDIATEKLDVDKKVSPAAVAGAAAAVGAAAAADHLAQTGAWILPGAGSGFSNLLGSVYSQSPPSAISVLSNVKNDIGFCGTLGNAQSCNGAGYTPQRTPAGNTPIFTTDAKKCYWVDQDLLDALGGKCRLTCNTNDNLLTRCPENPTSLGGLQQCCPNSDIAAPLGDNVNGICLPVLAGQCP